MAEVSEEERSRLSRMLIKFDKKYITRHTIEDLVTISNPQLPFDIVQVSNGLLAHVVTDNGDRLFVGDEVDGFRLVNIDEQRIVFDGKHRIEVMW